LDSLEFMQAVAAQTESLRTYIERRIPPAHQALLGADDVLQEVLLRAFVRSRDEGLPEIQSLDAWLRSIADRRLVDVLRLVHAGKRGGNRSPEQNHSILEGVVAPGRTPSGDVAAGENESIVLAAIASLPEAERRVIHGRYLEGQPYIQIASDMGKSLPAIQGHLVRGLRRLRSFLGGAHRFFSGS
jgi:RNA polymerase sigma factor (sigma-70 family)